MQALFLVLHKVECFDDLLINLQNGGINGGTIMNSTGMINTLRNNENFLVNSLRIFLEDIRAESKVLFFILENKEIDNAKKIINDTLGGIDNPNTGIMFGIDLTFVEGIMKRNP